MAISTGSIDVSSIVTQLMTVERAPLQKITQREANTTLKIDAMSRVQGALANVQAAATRLAAPSLYTTLRAASSGDAVSATVTDQSAAVAGTSSIKVTTLAAAHAVASTTFASSTENVGLGVITLEVGSESANITIGAANQTLAGVRDAINAAKVGVTAAIVNDGGQVRLTLAANDTGAANHIKLTVVEQGTAPADVANTDATDLSRLTFDSAIVLGVGQTTVAGRQMIQTRAAEDAAYTVNGLALTSTSNQITGVVPGLTLELRKASADTVTDVTVSRDSAAARAAINEFVKAYNEFDKVANEVTAYNATSRTAAVLNGDNTVRNAQFSVRALVRASLGDAQGGFSSFSDIGLTIGKDNTLSLSTAKFEQALAQPDQLARLMTQSSNSDSAKGLATRLKAFTDSAVGTTGTFSSRIKGYQTQVQALDTQKDRINRRLVDVEERLRKQYAALDAQLQKAQSTSQSLENALKALPSTSNSQ